MGVATVAATAVAVVLPVPVWYRYFPHPHSHSNFVAVVAIVVFEDPIQKSQNHQKKETTVAANGDMKQYNATSVSRHVLNNSPKKVKAEN